MSLINLPFQQLIGSDGRPLSGAELFIYADDDSDTLITIYSDPALEARRQQPVRSDQGGFFPAIYMAPGSAYRVRLVTPDGRVRGAVGLVAPLVSDDASAIAYASPTFAPDERSGVSVQISAADFGRAISLLANGYVMATVLPALSDVREGALIALINAGTNQIVVSCTGFDLIEGRRSITLAAGETVIVRASSDGFGILVKYGGRPVRLSVLNRQEAVPPSAPAPGSRYLAPTNATGGWSPNIIYEADGSFEWIAINPSVGMEVCVLNETETINGRALPLILLWNGSAWISRLPPEKADPALASVHPTMVVAHAYDAGVAPHTITTASWQGIDVNTLASNSIDGASLENNQVILPEGKYRIRFKHVLHGSGASRLRLASQSTSVAIYSMPVTVAANTGSIFSGEDVIEVGEDGDAFELQAFVAVTAATVLGIPANNGPELYGEIVIERIG